MNERTMKSDMPLVSTIIPVYNREDRVSDAIRSAIAQTYNNQEIIIVDDRSTDDSVKTVKQYTRSNNNILLIEHDENKGGSAARNTGIKHASGQYIAFLDSDDIWHPTKLEGQIKLIESRGPNWKAAYCGAKHISSNPISNIFKNLPSVDPCPVGDREMIKSILTLSVDVGSSTIVAHRDEINSINGFDESFDRHQDYEFMIRLLKQTKIEYLPLSGVLKYDTDYASAEGVEESKQKLLGKFQKDVEEFERRGYPIRKIHNFDLARCHIRNGDPKKAATCLQNAKPSSTLSVLSLGKAVLDRILSN
jgi:glycosyltransferase involved in cell wall biosynthesis